MIRWSDADVTGDGSELDETPRHARRCEEHSCWYRGTCPYCYARSIGGSLLPPMPCVGRKPVPENPERYASAVRMRGDGMSYETIAKRLHLSTSTVHRWLKFGE